jgi:hypothetical protein
MHFTTVKRAVKAVHVDGFDDDRAPEVEQVHGEVTFYPMLGDGDSVQVQTVDGPVTVVLTPIKVRISDGLVMHRGGVGVQLFAGGDGSEPSLIRWRARFSNLQSQGVPLKLRDVIFDAIPDGEVDLTTAAPLANAPEPIIRGPQGVSVDTLVVEGGDLVVWGRSETGRQVLSRIPMSDVTREAAKAAAADTIAKVKATLDKKADADTVTAGLGKKSDKGHTHQSKDVTDASSTPAAGLVVKYDAAGLFTVGVPTAAAHPATKKYVDDGLAAKADKDTVTAGLASKAAKQHGHPIADVTGLQGALDAKATVTALTDGLSTKAEKAHQHDQADIRNLDTTLAGKANKVHRHTVGEVDGLTDTLSGKADTGHTHLWSQVGGKPTTFPPSAHKHSTGDVTGLDAALNSKAASSHKHSIGDVNGLQAEIGARPNAWCVKSAGELDATERKARPGDKIFVVDTGEVWEVY